MNKRRCFGRLVYIRPFVKWKTGGAMFVYLGLTTTCAHVYLHALILTWRGRSFFPWTYKVHNLEIGGLSERTDHGFEV
jgi:hypothetical protein